jgi:serine/threonine protein phosphatase PrpC
MNPIDVHSAGLSHQGLVRAENQDQFFIADLTRSMRVKSNAIDVGVNARLYGGPLAQVYFVADGMGGHKGGSEASKLAIEYLVNSVLNSAKWLIHIDANNEESFVDEMKNLLSNAHQAIQDEAKTDKQFEGMGTTLTMAYVAWPKLFVLHAGDTRCYVIRNKQLKLITRDHTVANQMMQSGKLDPSAVERSPWSNVLVNALGAGAQDVVADVYRVNLEPGDSVLLCSDGLNKHVSDAQIGHMVQSTNDVDRVCHDLVEAAKLGGGSDNITVVLATFRQKHEHGTRMQITMSESAIERLLMDVALPESEMETLVIDHATNVLEDIETSDFPNHDTMDF